MKVLITYKEIADYIENQYKVRLKFAKADSRSIEISCKPKIFLPDICVKLTIKAMRKDIICLSYACSQAVSLIFSGIVSYLQEKLPRGITINAADHRIDVYPHRIKQIEKILSVAELSDITFGENEVIVELIV